MSETISSQVQCGICLESVLVTDCVHMCSDKTHSGMCKTCALSYISNKIESAFLGSCPTMLCPCTHSDGRRRRTLDFKQWRLLVPEIVVKEYTLLADSILAYLCGGCHSLKSLQITSTEEQITQAQGLVTKAIQSLGSTVNCETFMLELNQFSLGELSVEEFYSRICSVYFSGSMITGSDKDVWEEFKRILRLIIDPERRANLHLRHLRSRPRIWTPCCHREHCFRCRTKDFHDRKSCDENTSSLDQTVISCPSCCIAIAKGDGCNTVFCVCGKQFSWAAEKESLQRSAAFLALYPEDTSEASAQLLCVGGEPAALELAKAWQSRNIVAVSQALIRGWSKRYADCPHQACAMLPLTNMTDGLRESSNLWNQGNKKEVDQCRAMNLTALKAVFTSLFREEERPSAALRILGITGIFYKSHSNDYLRGDSRMVSSTRLWREENTRMFDAEIEEWEKRTAMQFIYLYGSKCPGATCAACARFPSPIEWDIESSNSSLTFTNNNSTAERAGSVSCYPAAFANLPADRSVVTIIIDACPRGTNWLTFGVALKGSFKCYSSDGVGRSPGSWGISDDRSSFDVARVCGSGGDITTCRKFVQGDRVSAMIDTAEGWCNVAINGDEISHRFDIPLGRAEDYMFVTTFANDHKVTIVPEGGDGYQSPGQLNADHSEMLCCLKKRMRKIVCGDSTVNIESVEALSAKWIELTGTERAARGEMAVVTPIIEGIIGKVFGKWKQKEVTNDSTHESDTNRGPEPCNIQSIHNSSVEQTLRTLEIREKLRKKYELLDANAIELIFSSDKSESENGSLDSCKSSIIATATASTTIDQSQSVSVSVSKVKSRSDDYRGGCSLESVMIAMEREREMGDNTILNRIMNSAGSGSNTLQTSEYVKEEEKLGISMDFNLNLVSPMKVKSVSCDLSNNNNNENNDNSNNNNNDADPLPQSVVDPFEVTYNWEEIIYAVCWYRVNRTELEVAEQWTLAQRFLNLHGDSAPFIAAAYCASCADSQSSFECPGEEEKKMALAFMGHFPEDMEGWYEYNAGLEEPMLGLERSDKACRCIPRHFKKCPIPFDPSKMSEGDTKRARRDV